MTSQDLSQDLKPLNFGFNEDRHKKNAGTHKPKIGAVLPDISDGDLTPYTPQNEIQKSSYCDYMDCVSESATNALKILMMLVFGIEFNPSQRFTAKMSGTTESGNDQFSVADSLNKDGFVPEEDWKRGNFTWKQYYMAIPQAIKSIGKKYRAQFELVGTQIGTRRDELRRMSKKGAIQLIGHAWEKGKDGMYYDYHLTPNHAFLLAKVNDDDSLVIYDSYPTDFVIDSNSTKQEFTKILAPNFNIAYAMLYTLKAKSNKTIMDKLKEVIRDVHGKYWFIKGDKRQGVTTIGAIMTIIARQFGILKDNVTEQELKKWKETNDFF